MGLLDVFDNKPGRRLNMSAWTLAALEAILEGREYYNLRAIDFLFVRESTAVTFVERRNK